MHENQHRNTPNTADHARSPSVLLVGSDFQTNHEYMYRAFRLEKYTLKVVEKETFYPDCILNGAAFFFLQHDTDFESVKLRERLAQFIQHFQNAVVLFFDFSVIHKLDAFFCSLDCEKRPIVHFGGSSIDDIMKTVRTYATMVSQPRRKNIVSYVSGYDRDKKSLNNTRDAIVRSFALCPLQFHFAEVQAVLSSHRSFVGLATAALNPHDGQNKLSLPLYTRTPVHVDRIDQLHRFFNVPEYYSFELFMSEYAAHDNSRNGLNLYDAWPT